MSARDGQVARGALVAYGGLGMPLAFAGLPLYLYAPDYYVTGFQVALTPLALILFFLRLIDALQDPLIGLWSDRQACHREKFIVFAAPLLVVSFFLLFDPPQAVPLLVWFALTLFAASLSFSIASINLNTLGGLWSFEPAEKTRIVAFREGFAVIGLTIALVLPGMLKTVMSARDAFALCALVLAVLMTVMTLNFLRWYRAVGAKIRADGNGGNARASDGAPRPRFLADMPRSIRVFFAIYAISMLASSIPVILVLFYIRDYLGAESWTGAFLLAYFLAGIIGMAVWRRVAARAGGKEMAWFWAMLLAVAAFSLAFFLKPGALWGYGVICILSGLSVGADLMLPYSILADRLDETGRRAMAARHFALLAFISKASLALASALCLPFLDLAGFQPAAQNSAAILLVLATAYTLLPCAIKLVSAFLLYRHCNQRA